MSHQVVSTENLKKASLVEVFNGRSYPEKSIVIFDGQLPHLAHLRQSLSSQYISHTLSSEKNSITQISEILQAHAPVAQLHIVSHGAPGQLHLGQQTITVDSLKANHETIAKWQTWLTDQAEILLYGCNVAQHSNELLTTLAQLTQASVAASKTLVGAAAQGGSWLLDAVVGTVQSALPWQPQTLQAYSATLGTIRVGSASQLQAAIDTASSSDIIQLNNNIRVYSQLNVRSDVTIYGDGYALTGGFENRILDVRSSSTLTLHNIKLAGGKFERGGAIYIGNGSKVAGSKVDFQNNSATGIAYDPDSPEWAGNTNAGDPDWYYDGRGGAVFMYGAAELVLADSAFNGNKAIGQEYKPVVSLLPFTQRHDAWGGAISVYDNNAKITLIDTDFNDNYEIREATDRDPRKQQLDAIHAFESGNQLYMVGGNLSLNSDQIDFNNGSKSTATRPTLSFNSFLTPNEGRSTKFSLRLSEQVDYPIEFRYRVDIDGQEGAVQKATIPANLEYHSNDNLLYFVSISLPDDAVYNNPARDVALTLYAGRGYTRGFDSSGNILSTVRRTIVDDEPLVSVVAVQDANEDGADGVFEIQLDKAAPRDFTIEYTLSTTGTEGEDFESVTGIVSIKAGDTKATIPIEVIDDLRLDPNETVTVTLTNTHNNLYYGVDTSQQSATLTIIDNEVIPQASLSLTQAASEDSGTAQFTIQLDNPALAEEVQGAQRGTIFYYTVTNGSAEAADYTAPTGSVFIAAGQTSATVSIPITDDRALDPDETFTVQLVAGSNYTVNGSQDDLTFTITDNNVMPVASVQKVSDPSETGETPGEFTITLDNPALEGGVTVEYEVVGSSTATAGADYTAPTGRLFIAEGETQGTVTIAPIDDSIYDPNETLTIRLKESTSGALYEIGTQDDVTFTLSDNEHLYQVSLSPAGDASEDGTAGYFKVILDTAAPVGGLRLVYSLSGQATADADYVPLEGEVIVPEGQTEAFIRVQPLDDQFTNGDRTLTLTFDNAEVISEGTNYRVNGSTSATINITDNDTAGVVVTPLSTTTSEAGNTAEVEVRLTSRPTEPVTVTLTSSNTAEGTLDAPSVTFQPEEWNTAKVLTVRGVDDGDIQDGSQAYTVTTSVSSADANYDAFTVAPLNFTNLDNDGFDLLISTPARVGEGDTVTYMVGLTKAPSEAIPVEITAQPQTEISLDGVTFSDTLTVDLSDTGLQTITVRAVDDTTVEGIHTSAISHRILSHGDGNYPTDTVVTPAVITIVDNDSPTLNIVQVDPASEESGISGRFALALDQPAPADGVVVNYTVSVASTAIEEGQANPDFYQLSRSVFIEADSTGTDVIVLPVQNSISENPESVVIELAAGDGYVLGNDASANLIIYDDDIPGVRIRETGNTSRILEGIAGDQYTIELTSQPTANVVIDVLTNSDVTPGTTQLVFTPGNWKVPQTVQLDMPDNDRVEGDRTETIRHTITSTDSNYANLALDDVSVHLFEDDTPGIRVTQTGNSTDVVENGSGDTYSVVLESEPLAPVTITLDGGSEVNFDQPTLTFTAANWNQPQTVTVNAITDDIDAGDRTATVTHTVSSADSVYDGFEVANVTVNITEDNEAGILIQETGPRSRVKEDDGIGDSIEIILGSQPTADVTFSFTTDSDVAPIEDVTITPDQWNNIRTVQFFAATDALSEPDIETSEIQISVRSDDPNYNNVVLNSISVDVLDRELNAEETAQGLEQALDQIDAFIAAELTALDLPLIPLEYVMPDFIGTFRDYLVNEIRSGGNATADAVSQTIQSALQTSFDRVGLDAEVGVDFGITLDEMTFDITIGNTYEYNTDISADLGIPALVLGVDGEAIASFDYQLGLGIGFSEIHGFFVNTDTTGFDANINVGVDEDFTATGGLGLIGIQGVNNPDDPTGANINFSVGLNDLDNVSVVNDGDRLTLAELSSDYSAKELFDPTLSGNVNVGLQVDTKLFDNATLPSFLFNLDVDWDAFGYEDGELVGLQTPTIAFNNLQVDVGTFVTNFAKPVFGTINDVIDPLRPVLDFINEEKISAFKDYLGYSRSLTLREFLETELNGSDLLNISDFLEAVDTIDTISQYIDELANQPGNIVVDLGSYTVLDPDSEEIEQTVADEAPEATGTLQKLLDTLTGNPFIGVPVLTDPYTVIDLLLGEEDTTLFTFDPPALGIDVGISQNFELLDVAEVKLRGDFEAAVDLAFGFDTLGLYQWADSGFALDEAYRVFDGFYVSDRANADGTGKDVDEAYVRADVDLSANLDLGIAEAWARGGLNGNVGLDLEDPDGDGKVRAISELLDTIASGDLDSLFNIHGKVGIGGSVGGKFLFWEGEKSFGEYTLLRFQFKNGKLSIASAFDGPIAGAKVFFDADKDGIWDEEEPFTLTDIKGDYALEIPMEVYDLNSDGVLDLSEGRIVVMEGVDTDTNQAQRFAFSTSAEWSVASPLTMLTLELAGDATDTTAAEAQLKQALGLPDIDITTFNPLTAMAAGDPQGLEVYAKQVQINATLMQMADLLAGSGVTNADSLVVEAMTEAIDQGQSLNNLGNPETIVLLLSVADSTLSTAVVESASTLIAESNTRMDALAQLGKTDPAYLQNLREEIAAVQNVAQASQAERLQKLTSGEVTLEQFETAIDHRISSTGFVTEYDSEETPLFVVQRMGWLEGDSTVTFSISGESTYGIDYSNLREQVEGASLAHLGNDQWQLSFEAGVEEVTLFADIGIDGIDPAERIQVQIESVSSTTGFATMTSSGSSQVVIQDWIDIPGQRTEQQWEALLFEQHAQFQLMAGEPARSTAWQAIDQTFGRLKLSDIFDEAAYLYKYDDVAAAVDQGYLANGFEHFVKFGLKEGRNPSGLFDEANYLANNADVAAAVEQGVMASGLVHYLNYGRIENREANAWFDEADYLNHNSDVKAAVDEGWMSSAFEHYLLFGRKEGRLSNRLLPLFEEEYYLSKNIDVQKAVEAGSFESGFQHYVLFGQSEGRDPGSIFNEGAYLQSNQDVAAAVQGGQIASGFEHYLNFGRVEGRSFG